MEEKLILTPKDILEKQFEKDVKGYNPEEVDDFLDEIIKDYQTFKQFQNDYQEYISSLEVTIKKLKEQIRELEIKNSQLNTRVSVIKDGNNVTNENIGLLNRIDALEKALYSLGKNPKEIH